MVVSRHPHGARHGALHGRVFVAGRRGHRGLAHVPLAEVRGRRAAVAVVARARRAAVGGGGRGRLAGAATVDLHVFPEGGGVGVALVAPPHLAVVGLVRGVDVRVFLAVGAVGEPSVAAVVFAFEGFFSWKNKGK